MQRNLRMKKEIKMLTESPPHGISCWSADETLERLEAQILGGDDTPYIGGVFKLDITIPERYPFEPPRVRFVTPIYHPNIDNGGRICLDTLKMPPKGAWKPCLNVSTVLTSVQLLMAEPNPDDPLMTEIADEFRHNKMLFQQNAKKWTQMHAKEPVQDVENQSEGPSKKCEDKKERQSGTKRPQPMGDLTNKHAKLSSH